MSEEAAMRLSAMRRHMGHSGDGMAPGREDVVPWESGMSAERGPCHTPGWGFGHALVRIVGQAMLLSAGTCRHGPPEREVCVGS